jgi:multidrug resistance protein MdtO
MSTLAESSRASSDPLLWLREFFRHELAPYHGRVFLVARLVIAATIAMIITMTFRTPYGAFAALYALTISRASLGATKKEVRSLAIGVAFSAAYALFGATLALGDPVWRFLWVTATLFTIFYALRVLTDSTAASRFGYLTVITLPLWDSHISTELKIENILWAVFMITLAGVITFVVDLVFKDLRPVDDLMDAITERLSSVEQVLTSYADGHPPDQATIEAITRFALNGTSRLRRMLHGVPHSLHDTEQIGAGISLAGRAVDLAANLATLDIHIDEGDRSRIRDLAKRIAVIRAELARKTIPPSIQSASAGEQIRSVPLLSEIESIVSQLEAVFTGSHAVRIHAYSTLRADRASMLFIAGALSTNENLKFALRGCLATTLCYLTYNALAWPDISTSVTTCFVTAMTTIGASRQKQVLRLAGALVGGVVLGIGTQVFILPHLDSIAEFTVLFLAVTIPAAWIMTSSPRLSYFGTQIAVGFYLINLQEFKFQTSLEVARDRVIGIVLGLSMMWLAFDHLWAVPAIVEMKRVFISAIRSVAQFMREPRPGELQAEVERMFALRENINSQFDQVRAQADAVLFEFGSSRQHGLALRSRILACTPQLRTLFVIQTVLVKYRFRLPGFELPDTIHSALREFDERVASKMESIADRIEGKTPAQQIDLSESRDRLEEAIRTDSQGRLQTLSSLLRTAVGLITSLDQDCAETGSVEQG